MPPAKKQTTKSHCNECGHLTNHEVIAHRTRRSVDHSDDGTPISEEVTEYDFVECRGCESVSLRQTWSASFTDEVVVDYFPPAVSRSKPGWLSGIGMLAFGGAKHEIKQLLNEVYSSLFSDNRRVALMGVRAIVDIALTDKLGDIGGFTQKLNEAKTRQWITPAHHKVLVAAVDAGDAAAHRAYQPDAKQLGLVLDVVEHLVQLLYILEHSGHEIAKTTPQRGGKTPKGHTP